MLAELLGRGSPRATWEKALRVLMTKLRAVLEQCGIDGSTALTSAFGCYKLTLPAGTWIDVEAAAEAVERAEAALSAGDLAEVRSQGVAVAAIARRSFLPGQDGNWVRSDGAISASSSRARWELCTTCRSWRGSTARPFGTWRR